MWDDNDMWGAFRRKKTQAQKWLTNQERYDLGRNIGELLRSNHPLIDKGFLEKIERALKEIEDTRELITTLSQTHIAANMARKYAEIAKE